jgi:pyruvate/2-oxoglutarate dehydrogenase complex dihydrolipoamide dehydrogenase (E3) component
MGDRIVSGEDEDISNYLTAWLETQGVAISTGVKLTKVERSGSGQFLTLEGHDGRLQTLECTAILLAAGRTPVSKDLNLAAAGVKTHHKGIEVDAGLRTNIPHIWAVGDVTGTSYFTYVANAQGEVAALNAANGKRHELWYTSCPGPRSATPR